MPRGVVAIRTSQRSGGLPGVCGDCADTPEGGVDGADMLLLPVLRSIFDGGVDDFGRS